MAITCKEISIAPYLVPYTKTNSKLIIQLLINEKPEAMKHVEYRPPLWPGIRQKYLRFNTKTFLINWTWSTLKMYALWHMKVQTYSSSGKITAKRISNIELSLRIHKELLQFNNKNGNNQLDIIKWK